MKKLKPVVIFTTFWDAAYLVDSKCVLFDWHGNIKKLNLQSEPCNFSIKSVALSHPSFEKISKLKGIFRGNRDRLDFFCPSYDLLHKYHKDKDWNYYIEKYKEIMRNNKKDIGDWISSLELNNIYILCCWEDTSGVAKCHRKIIYDTLKTSRIAKDKLILIYRDGGKIKKNSGIGIEMQLGMHTINSASIEDDSMDGCISPTTHTTSSSISRGTMLWRNDRGELITAISDTGTMGASNGVS
jgi:hypothetical protein